MQHNDCPIGIPHCPRCAEYAMRGDILEIESLRARADALEAALRLCISELEFLTPMQNTETIITASREAIAGNTTPRIALANGERSHDR